MPYRTRLTGQLALFPRRGHDFALGAIKGNKILKLRGQYGADLLLFFGNSCAYRHENSGEQAWSEAELWVQKAIKPPRMGRVCTGQ